MMISPESYYEFELKGKTKEEIEKAIENLRKEMVEAQRAQEKGGGETMVCPSPMVMAKMDREYLTVARRALEEAGGTWKPTETEEKDEAFNASLDHLKKFTFEISRSLSLQHLERSWTIEKDQAVCRTENTMHIRLGDDDDSQLSCRKEEFLDQLKDLHMGEWRSHYFDPDYAVLDGNSWSINVEYDDGRGPVTFGGLYAYPWNIEDLDDILGICVGQVMES